ncbi:hypothetical protein [Psittacicella gerlachiana]|uniref:Uncharacterized protein n=1 Tax=Psittacicella gerlachiana TaxID=2028574 RepID=A0A3A1YH86_9GAMM|nr:hypothetical protein [Psittacicella gerlachiana]RIY36430.1 hypothetical protein CKF59_02770 [Psittacicella gerlachiana]
MSDEYKAACSELNKLEELVKQFSQKNKLDNLVVKLNDYLTVTDVINSGLEQKKQNDQELLQKANRYNATKKEIEAEKSKRELHVKFAKEKFYLDCLKPSIDTLTAQLNKFSDTFNGDESLKANFEGITLILKSFEDNLVSLGLHTREEAKVTEGESTAQEKEGE